MADGEDRRSIGEPHSLCRIAYHAFMRRRRAAERHCAKPVITKKNFAVRTQHFHVSVEQKTRLRMAMVVLVEKKPPVRSEVEQSFYCFQIFDFGVMQLIVQLPELQNAGAADIKCQNSAEDAHVPE